MRSSKRVLHASPKHIWRDKDRLLLILMDLIYHNHIRDLTAIFNDSRKRELRQEGFRKGIPPTSLTAQFHEMRHNGTGSQVYNAINMLSVEQLQSFFDRQITVIEDTARRMKIVLIPKTHISRPQRPPIISFRRRIETMTETSVTTWNPNIDEDDADDADEYYSSPTRKRGQQVRFACTTPKKDHVYLPAMISPASTDTNRQRRPFFLYRAFEVKHGLNARRFVNDPNQMPAPPPSRSRAFANEVRPHLDRHPRYNSPFLSFAQNPAVAIKHAFTRVEGGTEMALAILRYEDIKCDATQRFGPECGPYLVPIICREHELWDLPGAYTGTGEFLAWGSVRAKPVAIVAGVDILMVRAILRTAGKVDTELGTRLGKYLPNIENEQEFELVLNQLLKGYRVQDANTARECPAYSKFVQAAMSARQKIALITPPATTNLPDNHDNPDFDLDFDFDFGQEQPALPAIIAGNKEVIIIDDSDSDFEYDMVERSPVREAYAMDDWADDTDSTVTNEEY